MRNEVYGEVIDVDVEDLLDKTLEAIDVINESLESQGVEMILQYIPKSSIH